MRNFLARLLRADFTLVEAYRCGVDAPLSCGLTVFGGCDDSAVPRALLPAWKDETTGACEIVLLPGAHFFFRSHPGEFFAAFSSRLEAAMHCAPPH